MKTKGRILNRILGVVFSVSLIIVLLISAFEIAMYADFDFYQKEYEKYDVLSDLDMEMDDVMYVTEEMMAYLRGNREELSVITTVEGLTQDFFNTQDRLHMADVRNLFIGGLHLREGAAVTAVISLAVLFIIMRKRRPDHTDAQQEGILTTLAGSYLISLLILAVLLLLLGLAMANDFNAVFTKFHEIFFNNDLWLFDPAEDYMIRMLPEGLFFDFVIRIGGIFIAGLLVLLAASVVVLRHKKGKANAY